MRAVYTRSLPSSDTGFPRISVDDFIRKTLFVLETPTLNGPRVSVFTLCFLRGIRSASRRSVKFAARYTRNRFSLHSRWLVTNIDYNNYYYYTPSIFLKCFDVECSNAAHVRGFWAVLFRRWFTLNRTFPYARTQLASNLLLLFGIAYFYSDHAKIASWTSYTIEVSFQRRYRIIAENNTKFPIREKRVYATC